MSQEISSLSEAVFYTIVSRGWLVVLLARLGHQSCITNLSDTEYRVENL